MNIAADNLQDTLNEIVEETLAEHQNKDIQDKKISNDQELIQSDPIS